MATWILGIDPSASRNANGDFANEIGWALARDGKLNGTGELTPDPLLGFTRVRQWLRNKIQTIRISDPSPKIYVVVESVFMGPNARVFQNLTRVKAHIEAVALDASVSYREISPKASFVASTGLTQYPMNEDGNRRGTRKNAIRNAVLPRYNLPDDTSEHVVDAISLVEAVLKEQK